MGGDYGAQLAGSPEAQLARRSGAQRKRAASPRMMRSVAGGMRICIFGAGAVGGHIAAKLAASGNEVSVVARGPHLQAVQRNGLKLLHGDETILGRVRASERPADLGPQDCVIVTLKANMLGAFAEQAAPLLGRETSVVFAQNGIPWWYAYGLSAARRSPPDLAALDPAGKLRDAVAPERIIGAVVYSANEVIEPGVIRTKPSMLQDYERGRPMEIEAQLMTPPRLRPRGRRRHPDPGCPDPPSYFQSRRQGPVRNEFFTLTVRAGNGRED